MTTTTGTETLKLEYLHTVGFIGEQGGRGFHLPVDMTINSEGKIYVASRSHMEALRSVGITMATSDHEFFGTFGSYGNNDGQMIWPTALACDKDDRIYLADQYIHRVTVFDKDGNFLSKWGTQGSGDGEIDGPAGLAFDSADNLYVADHRNHRIQKFTKDGQFLGKFGSLGNGDGEFNLPWGITLDAHDNVYVADWRNDRIQKFTSDGKFLAKFGTSGDGDGQFYRPSGVAVDSDGNLYVADWGNQRVQVLAADGTFLLKLRGESKLSAWAQEYLEANADELRARSTFVPEIEVDTDDVHERSARIESYFWDPVSVMFDQKGRLLVLETNRHRFQVYQKSS